MFTRCIYLSGLVLLSACSFAAQTIQSAKGGIDLSADRNVKLLLPAEAGPALRFSAGEMIRYLKIMTSDSLSITTGTLSNQGSWIEIVDESEDNVARIKSDSKAVSLPDNSDEYTISVEDGILMIHGGSDRAVLFGVYDVLERLGCRWFGPDAEFVPVAATLELDPQQVHEKPAIHWRGLQLISGSNPAIVDWMAKMRLNVTWPDAYLPNKDLTANEAALKASAVPEMIQRGMTMFWGGHLLTTLVPVEKYKDHPEYFALIKGKRLDPDADIQERNQLCVSNPDVMRILTENMVEFLRNHPWIDVTFLWAGDTVDWCECDQCRAMIPDPDRTTTFGGLDRAPLYTYMIKTVSEGVHRELPDRRIGFNHYYNLENLPTDKDGKLIESLLPPVYNLSAVDDYHQCNRHPFSDDTCNCGKRIEPIAKMWNPHYPEAVSWSYYFAWNFSFGLPISMVHKIPDDFQFLRGLGVQGVLDNVTLEPGTLHWTNNLRNFYIYGKSAWNPDLDVKAVMEDYDRHFYGSGFEPMHQAWNLIEEATLKYGQSPEFMPENPAYAEERALHGRMRDIEEEGPKHTEKIVPLQTKYLIPNRSVYDQLEVLLKTAITKTAAEHIYVDRITALKSVIDSWDMPQTAAVK